MIARMHSFGVKSILDYSVEEDISQEEAEQREMDSCVSRVDSQRAKSPIPGVGEDKQFADEMERYQAHKEFGDRRIGVYGARTFFYQGEANCERNLETFLRCIETVANTTQLQLSEVIARARRYHEEVTGKKGQVIEGRMAPETYEAKLEAAGVPSEKPDVKQFLDNMTYDRFGVIHLFNWARPWPELLEDQFRVPNLKTGELEPLMSALTEEEGEQFKNMLSRIHTVFQAAKDMDGRVMVDAEQTYFQPAISRITMEMMTKYNREKAVVFNTYQCYLKEAYNNLILDLEQSDRQDFFFGAKLVRGAYMNQERARATSLNYEDPINPDFEATSEMYHKCLLECMRRISLFKQAGTKKEKRGREQRRS